MSHSTSLDPESLAEDNLDALDPETYHAVVGPPLKVCADVAAKRGDPTLHADMAAMLALIDLVARLADLHAETHGIGDEARDLLNAAPAAACVMVLQEAKLDADAVGQCLAALEAAYAQLAEHDVTEGARPHVAMAWELLQDGDREGALDCLEQAARQIVAAIEAWQAKVH